MIPVPQFTQQGPIGWRKHEELKRRFSKLDRNADGSLQLQEMEGLFRESYPDITNAQLQALFESLDHDGNYTIQLNEFLEYMYSPAGPAGPGAGPRPAGPEFAIGQRHRQSAMGDIGGRAQTAPEYGSRYEPKMRPAEKLKRQFDKLDTNGDRTLSFGEMLSFLRNEHVSVTDTELEQLFSEVDKDHSGTVNFDEFVDYISATWAAIVNEN
jgi:Ca2+-binding EF-hand superfamily protein